MRDYFKKAKSKIVFPMQQHENCWLSENVNSTVKVNEKGINADICYS